MKPVVGIMPLWDEEKNSIWMLPGYMDGIIQAGAVPVIFPFLDDKDEISRLVNICDGILFTGGQDVSPKLYGEEPLDGLVSCCERRDTMEAIVLKLSMESEKPILGICRGIQFINAALGGTLYQDLPLQHPSDIGHHQNAPYDAPAHEVSLIKGSPLQECLKTESLPVNSYHHQAVKRPAPGLEVMAFSPDGLAEALYMPSQKFLWAVQWHPEYSYKTDQSSRKIFRAFVESMKYIM